jgi:phosphatidylglycerophosphate synthase
MADKPLVRVHGSRIADAERRMMLGVAARLPGWVTPDHMTLMSLGGAALCFAGFVGGHLSQGWLALAAIGLVLNWAGDSLDGNMARLRRIERPRYGFYVDHTADVASQVLIFMGLALSPYVRFESGCLLLMAYWLAALFTFIRALAVGEFKISYFAIGPTEIRIGLLAYIASLATLGTLPLPTPFGARTAMDLIAIVIFTAVLATFVVLGVLETRRLGALDRRPEK